MVLPIKRNSVSGLCSRLAPKLAADANHNCLARSGCGKCGALAQAMFLDLVPPPAM